jgi:hypothetical protein
MNTVASLISGQFTRSLILGAFFPVVLFLFFGYLTLDPILPPWGWVAAVHKLNTEGKAGVISAAAIVATVFLYNLNTPLVRFLEGYPWKASRSGRRRIARWTREHDAVKALLPHLRTLRAQWDGVDKDSSDRRRIQDALNRLQELLNAAYPSKPNLILPTRFGNVLRSFETYPLRQYEMDGVVLWPRIVSLADKDTLGMVEDARSSLDFFVNCMVLSAILAALLFVLGCCVLDGATPRWQLVSWALEVAALGSIALLCYAVCPSKIAAWGGQVKSVFDLFRGDLLKKMGYTQVASTRQEERDLWREISRQIIFGDPTAAGRQTLPYAERESQTTVVSGSGEALEVTGGVVKQQDGVLEFHYRIKNRATDEAKNVLMTERLVDGYRYVWKSLKKGTQAWEFTGANPYAISLGDMAAGAEVEISYSAVDLRPQQP